MGNGKYRKIIDFIVIAGMIAVWTFRCCFILCNIAFKHNLGTGRY